MKINSSGFAAIFILLLGVVILVFIVITLYTDLLKDNPAVNYLTSPESKNLAEPSPMEVENKKTSPTTSSSTITPSGSRGIRCESDEDCKSLDYCTQGPPEICYVGKCLIRTCVTEKRFF